MADAASSEQVDNEINVEQLKVLKAIFEVNPAHMEPLIVDAALAVAVPSFPPSPAVSASLSTHPGSCCLLMHPHMRRPRMRMDQGSWILMSFVPSWAPTWGSTSSRSRWRSCS